MFNGLSGRAAWQPRPSVRGRAYTRAELLQQVWGTSLTGYEHTVNSHINRLRLKIEQNPARPQPILTVWGIGY